MAGRVRLSTRPELAARWAKPIGMVLDGVPGTEEVAMGEVIEGVLGRSAARRGPQNLAEELEFLDAYGHPFSGGMLEALIQGSETKPPRRDAAKPTRCEIIYWQFRTAADRRHRSG